MRKEIIVFSLGGSLIVPDSVDYKYLHRFKSFINKLSRRYKIIIVTGGGKTARSYIKALKNEKLGGDFYSLAGIMATKLNARLVAGFFNYKGEIPDSLNDIKKVLSKNDIAVCGALGFQKNMTSDGNAAQAAAYFKAKIFVNLTNVNGLYDKDPNVFSDAKLINSLDYVTFLRIINKIKYSAGQHFVLDQPSAQIIAKNKIITIIIHGKKLNNVNKYLSRKSFSGTIIC